MPDLRGDLTLHSAGLLSCGRAMHTPVAAVALRDDRLARRRLGSFAAIGG